MSINISSNFDLDTQLPLDARTVVADVTARNAIVSGKRYEGLPVYLTSTAETWQLQGGITNSDWILLGSGAGIVGTGITNSISYWQDPTTLTADSAFNRDPDSDIAYNANGWTADEGVDQIRYVDAATGSDSNNGLTLGTPWQTIGYALSKMPIVGSGTYRINVAAGTYSLLALSIPSAITAFGSPLYGNTLIEIIGDETTPSNVVFSNTGTIIYHSSPNVVVRFAGIRFEGNTSNDCYEHRGTGAIFFKDCEWDNFNKIGESQFGGVVYLELSNAPHTLTDVTGGFAASVGSIIVNSNQVDMTYRTGLSDGSGMFSLSLGGTFANLAGSGATFNLTGDVLGSFVSAEGGTAYIGDGCNFIGSGITTGFALNNSAYFQMGEGNSVDITSAPTLLDVRGNSYFRDSDTTWTGSSISTGVIVEGGSRIESNALVNTSIPLLDLVTWFSDPNSVYGLDNRYLHTATVRTFGNLPQNYTTNYLTDFGSTVDEYPIYIAKGKATIVGIEVFTGVPNGSGHTDTYQVYVNGAAPSTTFGVTITNDDSASDFFGDVPLVFGDRVSVVFSSDAATVAENVTVQVYIRVEG